MGNDQKTVSLSGCSPEDAQFQTGSSESSLQPSPKTEKKLGSRRWPSERINCLTPFVAPWPDSSESTEHE